jgi:hypothetical protein
MRRLAGATIIGIVDFRQKASAASDNLRDGSIATIPPKTTGISYEIKYK